MTWIQEAVKTHCHLSSNSDFFLIRFLETRNNIKHKIKLTISVIILKYKKMNNTGKKFKQEDDKCHCTKSLRIKLNL